MAIWQKLQRRKAIIPSLFQDFYYLKAGVHCLRQLVNLSKFTPTMQSMFLMALAECAKLRYNQLFLYANQHSAEMLLQLKNNNLVAKPSYESNKTIQELVKKSPNQQIVATISREVEQKQHCRLLWAKAQEQDLPSLSIDQMHADNMPAGNKVTMLFVRQHVYFAFFVGSNLPMSPLFVPEASSNDGSNWDRHHPQETRREQQYQKNREKEHQQQEKQKQRQSSGAEHQMLTAQAYSAAPQESTIHSPLEEVQASDYILSWDDMPPILEDISEEPVGLEEPDPMQLQEVVDKQLERENEEQEHIYSHTILTTSDKIPLLSIPTPDKGPSFRRIMTTERIKEIAGLLRTIARLFEGINPEFSQSFLSFERWLLQRTPEQQLPSKTVYHCSQGHHDPSDGCEKTTNANGTIVTRPLPDNVNAAESTLTGWAAYSNGAGSTNDSNGTAAIINTNININTNNTTTAEVPLDAEGNATTERITNTEAATNSNETAATENSNNNEAIQPKAYFSEFDLPQKEVENLVSLARSIADGEEAEEIVTAFERDYAKHPQLFWDMFSGNLKTENSLDNLLSAISHFKSSSPLGRRLLSRRLDQDVDCIAQAEEENWFQCRGGNGSTSNQSFRVFALERRLGRKSTPAELASLRCGERLSQLESGYLMGFGQPHWTILERGLSLEGA
ncbi:hypothetical protein CIHG_03693 [Coccidioides immitis H538.4]|uniref:Uncharacterized protein n=3 Tax=Coccidioides immitis TaxID=5501 RepID=A0A0J8R229_COCIT|nr:hypothetical protein CIRG_04877 [Coccidioides immitis RMSCC 2394]KMU77723.1 hypothetical protein CISG_01479 [Coccidioides immitis RMSCC 3703]KMU85653.1 hypothetical protein CIHG_03693 [Coccidioides immitis H538.4]